MLRNILLMSLLIFIILFAIIKSALGETNTVSSTTAPLDDILTSSQVAR